MEVFHVCVKGENMIKQLPQRIFLYIIGVFALSLGVVFTINSNLGVSPIQAIPFVTSLITGFSMGSSVFAVLAVFTLLQILILRRDFKWIQITQLIATFFFGYFVDFSRFLLYGFYLPGYFGQLFKLFVGIGLTVVGVSLYTRAGLVNLPPEGLTLAIVKKTPGGVFHRVRIVQDTSLLIIAAVLSFLFLNGLYGIREGTAASALLVGKLIPFANRVFQPLLEKLGLGGYGQ